MKCACDKHDWCDYHAPAREQRDELLAALRCVLGCDERTGILTGNEHVRDTVKAAIAKAEGK